MRFSLRKKGKIINTFGEDYYKLLMNSLKAYFYNRGNFEEHDIEGYSYPFLFVPSVQPNTDTEFQFAVVSKTFNVYNLSYFSAVG